MKREIKVGIFAVAMIGAAWAGIRFLKGFDIFSVNNEYYAAYDQINGVQSASPIMMRGVKVGAVTGVDFDPSQSDKVVLRFTINRKYKIPTNSEAKIYSNGLMGAKAVEIIYGNASEYLRNGDTLRSGRDRDLMDVAGSELEFFKQKFAQLTTDLSRALTDVSDLLEKNEKHISGTLSHLNSLSANVDAMMVREQENLQKAIENFALFAQSLGANSEKIDHILSNLDSFSTQLSEQDLVAGLHEAVAEFNALLGGMNQGQGTVGKMLKDPALYESLTEASENLSVLLEDLKKYPGRYVHLSLFGRNPEKMKAKADRKVAKQEARQRRDSLKMLGK